MMTCREFDVIIFGATGYTGEHIAREMHALASKGGAWQGVAWAIGGRSQPKLSAMAAKHGLTPAGVVIADTSDAASLRSMTARAKVVMNATGPYRFYGEAVVEACIATKTDYVDLCGEPEFIDRCLLKHADAAEAAGVLIVHACAFDSVPADIGCLYTALQYPPPALTLTLIPTLTLILTLTLTLTLTRYPPANPGNSNAWICLWHAEEVRWGESPSPSPSPNTNTITTTTTYTHLDPSP